MTQQNQLTMGNVRNLVGSLTLDNHMLRMQIAQLEAELARLTAKAQAEETEKEAINERSD